VSSETILVVDDSEENREFVVDYILTPNAFNALTAKDGREGIKIAADRRPDLILLDLQMPIMDGRDMLHALSERGLDIPVILMTFHGSEEIAVEMYRMGVKDYLKKPFTAEEMLQTIERNLSEVRLRKEKDALVDRLINANQDLKQRIQELNILYKVGKSVTGTFDLAQLFPQIIDAAIQMTNAEEGRLYLKAGDQVVCRAERRLNIGRTEIIQTSTDNPAVLHVIRYGKEVIANREQFNGHPDATQSAVYAPLMIRGEAIGVIGVNQVNDGRSQFTKNDVALLSALSDYVAIAVENSRNFTLIRQQDQQEKEQIRVTFERFVPPTVVERALANPDELKLGGVRQEVTVLFADIRGYTAWSEKAPPEKVMELLNDYLSNAAELVMAWEGTLDKFFGDGLMAIFNAPQRQSNHVHRAIDTALALLRAGEDLNQRKGYGLSYSIGVNVGEAVVGYIGTPRALNYTAIGDVVNVAKRLQEMGKPGQILVTDTVVEHLGTLATTKLLGELKMRNRQTSANVHQILTLAPLL
jgi:class 3 adenylate cyclase/DNA-binding response OmpR family regulator